LTCAACGAAAFPHRDVDGIAIFRCRGCATRTLSPDYVPRAPVERLDEQSRVAALADLRADSARRVLARLAQLGPGPGARLLDVGCSYGWFLVEARRAGFDARGIDPDAPAVAHARAAGCSVTLGLFPRDLDDARPYDALTFNDVFEHLRDPAETLRSCRAVLAPSGVLVLNVPSTRGLFFQVAETAGRMGVSGPLARLFQLGFPSPHVYYYSPRGLLELARRAGFRLVARHSLPAVTWRSLRARVRMDRGLGRLRAAAGVAGLATLLPLSSLLPAPDFEVYYLRPA
jgi:SAM-dependent methyltransferase